MTTQDDFLEHRYRTPEERATAAALPVCERQYRIERMLIRYPLFKDIQNALRSFHMPVEGGRHATGRVAALLGVSRTGKTWAIKCYAKELGLVDNPDVIAPVAAYADAVRGSTSLDFAMALWGSMRLGSPPKINAPKMLKHIADEIKEAGTQLVIVDDAHWLLLSGDTRSVKHVQGFLIDLAERNCCTIILAGEPGIADAVEATPHLIGRGLLPRAHFVPYDWLDASGRQNFRFLLNAIDERLPFRQSSQLGDPLLAAHLYRLSGGLIGHVRTYIQEAAFLAMNAGADRVEVAHLRAAVEMHRSLGDTYVPFHSDVDHDDPRGDRRREDERKLHGAAAATTLTKKPRKRASKAAA